MLDSQVKAAHGGRRTGSGRKRISTKVRSLYPLPRTPATKVAYDAGIAVSEGVVEEGRRVARHALHAQKRAMTAKMSDLGLAPLDILGNCMLMLYERALDARAAGGALVIEIKDKPSIVETETALLIAASDVANKAAQYVHPKLLAVDAEVAGMSYEERLVILCDKI